MKTMIPAFWVRALPAACLLMLPGVAKTWVVGGAGDGTDGKPFKTIQQAADVAQPGDTILVKEGTYRERVTPPRGGTEGAPIRYMAEPGKNVVVKGSDAWSPKWEREGDLWHALPADTLFDDDSYIDDKNPFKVEMACTPYGREGKREAERGKPGNADLVYVLGMVFVEGKPLKQVPFKDEASAEAGTWWAEPGTGRLFLHPTGDLSKQVVEISTRRRCFAPHLRGLGYIEVVGFVFEHAATQYPVNFWEAKTPQWQQAGMVGTRSGHHFRIEGNTIRHSLIGIDFGYESMGDQARGDLERGDNGKAKLQCGDHLILSNRISDCGGMGTAAVGVNRPVIQGNRFERNNAWGFTGFKRYETAALKMHSPNGARIVGNLFISNRKMPAIWLDGGAGKQTVISGNLFVANEKGFDLEIGDAKEDNLLMAYNLFIDNEKEGIDSRESGGIWALGNLITGPAYAYHQQAGLERGGNWSSQFHHLTGNLMAGPSNLISIYPPDFKNRPDKFGGRRFEANVYGIDEDQRSFRIPGNTATMTLAEWKDRCASWSAGHEEGSVTMPGMKVHLNLATMTLTLDLPAALPPVKQRDARAPGDYAGKPWSDAGTAGPFAGLVAGKNTRKVWDGIPAVGPEELPFAAGGKSGK